MTSWRGRGRTGPLPRAPSRTREQPACLAPWIICSYVSRGRGNVIGPIGRARHRRLTTRSRTTLTGRARGRSGPGWRPAVWRLPARFRAGEAVDQDALVRRRPIPEDQRPPRIAHRVLLVLHGAVSKARPGGPSRADLRHRPEGTRAPGPPLPNAAPGPLEGGTNPPRQAPRRLRHSPTRPVTAMAALAV